MAIPFNIPSDEETANQYRSMDELFAQLYQVLRQIMLQRPQPVVEDTNVQSTNGHTTTTTNDRVNGDAAAAVMPDVIPDASRLSDLPRPPLPDIVQSSHPSRPSRRRDVSTSTPSTPLAPPRRGRRRRAAHRQASSAPPEEGAKGGVKGTTCECHTYPVYTVYRPQTKVQVRDNWSQVGEDLRRIADDFQSSIESLERKPRDVTDGNQVSNPKSVSTVLSLLVPSRPYTRPLWMTVIFILGWGVLQRAR